MIKIEVTGNSIPEVADKLLAIGASLRSTASNASDDAAREALQAKRNTAKAEVAEDAPVDPTSVSKSAPTADGPNSQPTTKEPSTTPAPAASVSEDEELEVVDLPIAPLNFETQVAPVVLLFVQKRSKEETSKILAEFGVERASMLDPSFWPDLVARLEAEMS